MLKKLLHLVLFRLKYKMKEGYMNDSKFQMKIIIDCEKFIIYNLIIN